MARAGALDDGRARFFSPLAEGSRSRIARPSASSATRIVVVTHGQSSDPFWSVVANGVDDAAKALGVRVEYQAPGSFDMVRMSQLIDAAVASRPSGLVVSVPDRRCTRPVGPRGGRRRHPHAIHQFRRRGLARAGPARAHRADRVRGGQGGGSTARGRGCQARALREPRGRKRFARPALPGAGRRA